MIVYTRIIILTINITFDILQMILQSHFCYYFYNNVLLMIMPICSSIFFDWLWKILKILRKISRTRLPLHSMLNLKIFQFTTEIFFFEPKLVQYHHINCTEKKEKGVNKIYCCNKTHLKMYWTIKFSKRSVYMSQCNVTSSI